MNLLLLPYNLLVQLTKKAIKYWWATLLILGLVALNLFIGTQGLLFGIVMIVRLALMFFFVVVQFIGIFWFLSRPKTQIWTPKQEKEYSWNDYRGQPKLVSNFKDWLKIMKNPEETVGELGGKPVKGVLLYGPPGGGKTHLMRIVSQEGDMPFLGLEASSLSCVAEGTEIWTDKGMTPIENVLPYTKVDTGLDGLKETSALQISEEEQELYLLESRQGYNLKALGRHPVLTKDGWKKIENVKENEWVALANGTEAFGNKLELEEIVKNELQERINGYKPKGHNNFEIKVSYPKYLNRDLAWLMGLVVGDGHICKTKNSKGFNRIHIISKDKDITNEIIRISSTLNLNPRLGICNPWHHVIYSTSLGQVLYKLGVSNEKSKYKVVPWSIIKGTKEIIAGFLSGLFDAEGGVTTYGHIFFHTSSKQLIDQVHLLLLKLGIVACKSGYWAKSSFRGCYMYQLQITGHSAIKFHNEVGFRIKRKSDLRKLIPTKLKPRYKIEDNIIWDRIKFLKKLEEKSRVYDLTIANGPPSYVANGFIVHNSMFMGVSILIIMSLFRKAKQLAKEYGGSAILYIDEIDAIGASRGGVSGSEGLGLKERIMDVVLAPGMGGSGMMGLTRLLVELDGLHETPKLERLKKKLLAFIGIDYKIPDTRLFVVGSTNRPVVLDPALIRPGRLDHHIYVGPPDKSGRRDIIKYYLDKIKHDNIEVEKVVKDTPGTTPALIEVAITQDAPRYAVFENRNKVSQKDISRAIHETQVGFENPIEEMRKDERKVIATHEAGHAVLTWYLAPQFRVSKATIIRHAKSGLGHVLPVPEDDMYLGTLDDAIKSIYIGMAGHFAVEEILETAWFGAGSDFPSVLRRIDQLAQYGLFGYPGSINMQTGEYQANKDVMKKKEEFWNGCVAKTKEHVKTYRSEIELLAQELLEHETLEYEDLERILGPKVVN